MRVLSMNIESFSRFLLGKAVSDIHLNTQFPHVYNLPLYNAAEKNTCIKECLNSSVCT